MTTLTATVDRIQAKAVDFNLARFLLTLLALPFFVAGWVVFRAWRALCVVCGWVWAAVIVGWQDAAGRRSEDE